jgi:drug/metabolite transporter (DMT)-like permease
MSTLRRRFSGLADSRRGILWMLFAMVLFANVNAMSKHLTDLYPMTEVVWARFFFHGLLLLLVFGWRVPVLLKSRNRALQLGRSALMLGTTTLIFQSLHLLPLVETSAMLATAPIIVTALSGPLLREPVGAGRWIAVAIAFTGALVIFRPGTALMQIAVLVPLAAAGVLSLYQTSTRLISRHDPVLTTFIYTPLVGLVVTSAAVPFVWVTPAPMDWLLMAGLGLFGGGAHFAVINAFAAAPAATVAPFNYSGILWAGIYGYFLFGDLPDAWTVTGALLIILSGIYIFRQEHPARPPADAA